MAGEFKFSITLKPSYLDRSWGYGFVDYAYYPRYIRDAWMAYIRNLGLKWPGDLILMVVKDTHSYKSPLNIEDEAKVYARQTMIGSTSGTMEFQIREAKSGRPISDSQVTAVWVDVDTRRPALIPEEWRKSIIEFEGKDRIKITSEPHEKNSLDDL